MFLDNMSDKQKKMLLGVVVFLGIYLMTDLLNCLDPVLGWFKSFVFQCFGRMGVVRSCHCSNNFLVYYS